MLNRFKINYPQFDCYNAQWFIFTCNKLYQMFYFRIYLFCFSLLSVNPFFCQNKKDSKGLKQGKWVYTGKDKKGSGYGANIKFEEGNYYNDRKTGEWVKFHPDGKTIKLKGNYVNNRPEGMYYRYYSNGVIREKGSFNSNEYRGELVRYHKNGQVAYRAQFNEKGEEMGVVKHYYKNGQVQMEYTKIDGKLSDKIKLYNPSGTLLSIQLVQAGKLGKITKNNELLKSTDDKVYQSEYPPKITSPRTKGVRFIPSGYNTIYNENDEIWQDGDFKEGQLFDGKVYIYGNNGLLIKVKVFKDGKFHSLEQL